MKQRIQRLNQKLQTFLKKLLARVKFCHLKKVPMLLHLKSHLHQFVVRVSLTDSSVGWPVSTDVSRRLELKPVNFLCEVQHHPD